MASATDDSQLIVVTGASGYIATHIIKQLQEDGYRVRGTVRSLQDENKIKHLNELCPDAQFKLELVEADLVKPESWEPAVKDATYVIHVASPFPNTNPKDESEIIQPAVEGTQHVLKACVTAKSVRRVVLTSSVAAIHYGSTAGDKVATEEDWMEPDPTNIYSRSKTLAEKAAWDFVKELPDEDKIELATINPAYVMGPVLHGLQCTSMEVPKRLLERSMPAVPKINFPVIDVRDVAKAHIKALFTPEAGGHRHIVTNTNVWMKEMAQVLSKEFKPQGHRHIIYNQNLWMMEMAKIYAAEFDPQGYNVPTISCPYFALWITGLFDKTVKMVLPQVGKVHKFDNTRMKDVLGIEPRDIKDTLIDMAYSMIEGGFIKKTKKYKGPNSGSDDADAEADKKEEEKKEESDEKPKENGEVAEEEKKEEKESEEEKKEEKPEEKVEEKSEKIEESAEK